MKISGAIFDFDGTLMDSMYVWENMASDYLLNRGVPPHAGLQEKFKTLSIYQAACYYRDEYGIADSPERITAEINAMVEKAYKYDVLPKAGVREFLQKLKLHGVKMCIATATDSHLIKAALSRCELSEYFGAIFTCTEIGKGKDEPDIYIAALEFMGTPKNETFVFEDAYFAVNTAKKAGFPVAGVYDKYEKNTGKIEIISDIYIRAFGKAEGLFE